MKRVIAGVLILAVLLTACGGFRRGNDNQYYDPVRARYFEGHDGVQMFFDQIPPRLFYYGNAPQSAANDFPVSIELRNEGSSYTRGGIFLSGYDPNLIMFDEIPIAMSFPGACSFRIGDWSLNELGFFVQCGDDFTWRGSEENLIDMISFHGITWFDDILGDIDFMYQNTGAGDRWDINFGGMDIGLREHGLALIATLSGLSFNKFLGREYVLAGDTYEYPGGEIEYVEFNGHIINWPQGTDEIDQTFLVTNCYMYTTFAAPTVCIDPQPYSENRKVCNPQVATWGRGQGAPVAVTRVTQENTPRTAVFHIEVANMGQGTVYDAGMLEKCSPYYPGGARSSDLNIIWFPDVRINNRGLDCTPRHFVRLDQSGRGSFTCTYPIEYAELNSAYQTPLVIELWYGYSETMERRVRVKRVT